MKMNTQENKGKQYWLISSNDSIFKLEECLNETNLVDWQGSFSPKVGDIVFIYRTRPIQRICYKTEVISINIPYRNTMNDYKFWGEKHSPKGATDPNTLYHRLSLLEESTSMSLHLEELKKQGMKGVPQGPRKLSGQLLEYILSAFSSSPNGYDEITDTGNYFEGALKQVYVNKYERDRNARDKCIEANGCVCRVCGMNFEKIYGELGKGFIHVHHIVPISTIGKEYKLNPVKDLVPVCPNCHAMLHRGKDGKTVTIAELKKLISAKS